MTYSCLTQSTDLTQNMEHYAASHDENLGLHKSRTSNTQSPHFSHHVLSLRSLRTVVKLLNLHPPSPSLISAFLQLQCPTPKHTLLTPYLFPQTLCCVPTGQPPAWSPCLVLALPPATIRPAMAIPKPSAALTPAHALPPLLTSRSSHSPASPQLNLLRLALPSLLRR